MVDASAVLMTTQGSLVTEWNTTLLSANEEDGETEVEMRVGVVRHLVVFPFASLGGVLRAA